MLAAYIPHADCALHEVGADHRECPERLGAIHDHLLAKGLLDCRRSRNAPLATVEQLAPAHSSSNVQDLIAESPTDVDQPADPDTRMNPFTVTAALRAAGALRTHASHVRRGNRP